VMFPPPCLVLGRNTLLVYTCDQTVMFCQSGGATVILTVCARGEHVGDGGGVSGICSHRSSRLQSFLVRQRLGARGVFDFKVADLNLESPSWSRLHSPPT
jgi:hypothetical protein